MTAVRAQPSSSTGSGMTRPSAKADLSRVEKGLARSPHRDSLVLCDHPDGTGEVARIILHRRAPAQITGNPKPLASSPGSTWMVTTAPGMSVSSAASTRSQIACASRTLISPGTTRWKSMKVA